MIATLIKGLVRLSSLLHGRAYRYSRPVEGNAATMGFGEKLWWGYKYFVRAVELAERGKGIEEYFAVQDLDFTPGDGFVETSGLLLSAGGDLLPSEHIRSDNSARLWDELRPFYFDADIVCANLEGPLAASAPPSFPPEDNIKAPLLNNGPEAFERIVDGGRGINFFSTANNHCLDQGEAGLVETLDFLDARGYPHVGTARSPAERDAVVALERKGVKLAFLAYTFSLNCNRLPEGRDYLANHIRLNRPDADLSLVRRQVAAAKAAGADAIVASVHWSLEYEAFPVGNVIDMGHRLAELGVDVILGNHPHNIQPIESYTCIDSSTGRARRCLIIYALGDLLSCPSAYEPNSRLGAVARIRISKGRAGGADCVRLTSLELKPTYLYSKMRAGKCEDFRILDFLALRDALAAGSNPRGLEAAEIAEIARLEELLYRIAGPAIAPERGKETEMRSVTIVPNDFERKFINVRIPMRDGVHLAADVTLPTGKGPFPTILYRTPYVKSGWTGPTGLPVYEMAKAAYVKNGYALVIQDVRGRGDSDGEFYPFVNEAEDGYDTIEWIAAQPWSDGKVGTDGTSYSTVVAFSAATMRPPHLAAIATGGAPGRLHMEDEYSGGVKLLYSLYWHYLTNGRTNQGNAVAYVSGQGELLKLFTHLPLDTLDEAIGFYDPFWHDCLRKGLKPAFYGNTAFPEGIVRGLNLPALHVTGWFDASLAGTMYHYRQFLRESSCPEDQYLIIGFWPHEQLMVLKSSGGGLDFGPESKLDMYALKVEFFDRYLKGKGGFDAPRVRLFDMNRKAWVLADRLPDSTPHSLYLDAATRANGLAGDGVLRASPPAAEGADSFVYDPARPTLINLQMGLADARLLERDDPLTYATEPLEEELRIAGAIAAKLYFESDAPDTDLFATVYDLTPDGRPIMLSIAGLRARYREGLDREVPLEAGRVYEMGLSFPYLYHSFPPGHRLLVEISSCLFPYFTRNLNTGGDIATDVQMRPARNTVHRSRRYSSRLLLPIAVGAEAPLGRGA